MAVPVMRENQDVFRYFISGRGKKSENALRRQILLENLRDLETEKDMGKIPPDEFARLAQPLATELQKAEENLRRESKRERIEPTDNSLGTFCPVCGCLNRRDEENSRAEFCIQCGFDFPPLAAKQKASSQAAGKKKVVKKKAGKKK